LNRSNESPGAVILGGSFPVVAAARNLAEHGVRVWVLGSATCVARFSRAVTRFSTWPSELPADEVPSYLVKLAQERNLQGWVLFPSGDDHVRFVSQHRTLLAKHYVLTTPPWESARFLYDKRLTYALAREAGVAIPRSHVPETLDRLAGLDLDFPVVIKPAVSSDFLSVTNRKAYRATNREELLSLYEKMSRFIGASQVIVQEFLPEPSKNLFSFGGFFSDGEPVVGLSVKRTRQLPTDFGRSSTLVEAVEIPELRDLSRLLLRSIRYTGLAELEFMWSERRTRFELLEVNARFWAWHGLAIDARLDLPYVAFAHSLGRNTPPAAMLPGLKWFRLLTDVRAAAQEIRSGTLSIRQYVDSLRGPKAFALFSLSDPAPFILEPFLLLLNRWKRRTRTR